MNQQDIIGWYTDTLYRATYPQLQVGSEAAVLLPATVGAMLFGRAGIWIGAALGMYALISPSNQSLPRYMPWQA